MFTDYLHEIGDAYATLLDRPADTIRVANNPTIRGWRELAEDSTDRAAGVRLLLDVRETDDPEPYADGEAMVTDIALGNFLVSTAHCEHPIWTPAENVDFRIVHDVLGHYAAGVADVYAGFDWAGEVAACSAHLRLLATPGARMALFTECLAQTAYAISRESGFAEQVIGDCGPHLTPTTYTGRGGLRTEYAAWLNGETI